MVIVVPPIYLPEDEENIWEGEYNEAMHNYVGFCA